MSIYNLTKTKQMKITEKDLIGQLEGFPIEIVEKMIEKQVVQGNNADVTAFQKWTYKDRLGGGFTWGDTTEGHSFWNEVIDDKNFSLFFETYPKQPVSQYPKVMEVSDDGRYWRKRVVFMEKAGCYIAWAQAETIEESEQELYTARWNYARDIQPTLTITKAEIAEKFGVSVDQLIIKD